MNKIIINIFILLWVAVGAMAQTATVTGTVTDDRVDSSLCRYGRSKRTVERTYLEH